MKLRHSLLLVLSTFLIAGCGGGGNNEPSTPAAKDPTYEQAPGTYVFPTYTAFPKAEKEALPALAANKIVVFCPVSAGWKNVYTWTDDNGVVINSNGNWPGKALSTKYNDKWYKVELNGDHSKIIFNDGGSKQTKDMVMDKVGYWWFHESDQDVHDDIPTSSFIAKATMMDGNIVRIVANKNIESFDLYEGDNLLLHGTPSTYKAVDVHLNDHKIDIKKEYRVTAKVEGEDCSKDINIKSYYATDAFNKDYAYYGNDLGVNYTVSKSTFKVWSPVSTEIKLRLYDTGTPASLGGSDTVYKTIDMVKGEKGVWSAEVAEDLGGKYYTYVVTNGTYNAREVVDPYAHAAGVNGKRGMILDLASTNPTGWNSVTPHNIDRKAMVVYESHIADLTSSSTWTGTEANRKKYAGFHEANTTYTKNGVTVKTGFEHIKELGVNAVQILPMYDQDNDETRDVFNWGYNPLNYNVPEGQYSSNPHDGAVRIRELKELVMDYNKVGINIIMDVVYNHVSSANGSNFDVLFPGYYFRYNDNNALSNGSGCGNETASDHYMFRKFMVDSATFWAKEYKLGGFRFDLMAIHDLDTMEELTAKVKEVFPGAVIYGEPWAGGTMALDGEKSAKQANGSKYVGYGAFNDSMRDALIKGGLSKATDLGWATSINAVPMTSEAAAISDGIKGTTRNGNIADPDKTVNYVACHDNYTIHDRVAYNYPDEDFEEDLHLTSHMAMLAEAVVMTSQGTSFMLSGDEFLRSKKLPNGEFDENSYESSYKTNEIDWNLKIENAAYYAAFKELVEFKISVDGMHLNAAEAAKVNVQVKGSSKNLIVYDIKDSANNKTYRIAHQAPFQIDDDYVNIYNPQTVDFSGFTMHINTTGQAVELSSSTRLHAGQSIIAVK